jgi:AcrR family transcriptional regulator
MNRSLMAPSQRTLPIQKRAIEKYELILKAACILLERKGFSGLSSREIAREAKCNIATIYRYFDGVNGIIKALGEPFFAGVSSLFDHMASLLIKGEPLDLVIQFFLEALSDELAQNRWVLHADAGIMTDLDLIIWDRGLMREIEIKLSGVLAIALPDKSSVETQLIAFRLVRHWKALLRTLIEYEDITEAKWLIEDTAKTSMALINADI